MIRFAIRVFFIFAICISAFSVHAQESGQILSVTPPLFQLSVLPGGAWQSGIKVVNGNSYPLTVYAEVNAFAATGERGNGTFMPVTENDGSTLAHWIGIERGPHTIPPEQTLDVPFTISVPVDAAPGGHYAAVLISTEPPQGEMENLAVRTSQAVTSLMFLRVEGDVDEMATIREFSTIDSFLEKPEVEFSLRFENKGNVHVQPRGDIVITNMWGTNRGTIPVNYQSHFGNVLPKSIRDFSFAWKSDFRLSDIGRYKAVATLAYGVDGIKSATATTYFWVVPLKGTLITIMALALFVWLIVMMVRAYIRRMLVLAGVDPDATKHHAFNDGDVEPVSRSARKIAAPIQSGVLDLRERLHNAHESVGVARTVWQFVTQYRMFFTSVFALILMFVFGALYISNATDSDRSYTVTVDENGSHKTIELRQ